MAKDTEETSLQINLTKEELNILKNMAEKRGVNLDVFLNQLLSKFCSY